MPKRAKLKDGETTIHEVVKENGINEAQLKGFVAEAESEMAEIDEIMREAAVQCQPHVDQVKAIKKEAAEAGIPKKVFSAKLRERSLLRKADSCRGTLSEEQQDIFDEVSQKLGQFADTDLGKAALDRVRPDQAAAH